VKNYILGSDILGSDAVGDAKSSADAIIAQRRRDQNDNMAQAKSSADAIIAQRRRDQNYMADTGRNPVAERDAAYRASQTPTSYTPTSSAPLYAASSYTAARGCGADGMTVWHYLFFVAVFAAIFFAPRIFVYAKRKFFSSPTKTDLVDAMPSTTEGRTS